MHTEPPVVQSFQHYDAEQGPAMARAKGSISSEKLRDARARLGFTIEARLAYIPLLICCFISGLTDSTLYSAYGTFVSMQTGNTIFFALGASGQNDKPYGWVNPLCSMGVFAIACITYARLSSLLGNRRRSTLALSFFLQTICVVLSAALVSGGVINGGNPSYFESDGHNDWLELVPVALLSFQAAGQIVNSRTLGVNEIPTVVITSLLCDLMSDPKLWAPIRENAKRNKRIGAFVLTAVGGICGGWIFKAAHSIEPALWAIAGIKLVITVTWLFWTPENRPGSEIY